MTFNSRLISRTAWGAREPRSAPRYAVLSKGQAIHWTWKPTQEDAKIHWPDCYNVVRGIQNYHMDGRGWNDTAYNFIICPHGFVFEGRGWEVRNGASGTAIANEYYLAICAILGEDEALLPEYLWAYQDTIAEAIERGAMDDQKPHKFFKNTSCPGPDLTPLALNGELFHPFTPEDPVGSTVPIMGPPSATFEQALHLWETKYAVRSKYSRDVVKDILRTYWRVCIDEGVDFAVTIAQVFKETGGFGFGGDVASSQWNFAGIGATGGVPGITFPSIEAGVRAHVRRLRMYAVGTSAIYDEDILYRPLPDAHWGAYPDTWTAGQVWAAGTNYNESWVVDYILPLRAVTPPTPPTLVGATVEATVTKVLKGGE